MGVFVGTSGWQYADWRGRLYPKGLAQARWLEYYAERFETVELNSTFYRLPAIETFEDWRRRTPEDFVFAVKASRYLSHIRLRDPAEPVSRLMERAAGLGHKLGPVLVQLRDTFRVDLGALDEVLSRFPRGTRVAFEPRHPSWHTEATGEVLSRHGAAFCLTDSPKRTAPLWRTTDWGYLRFHEGQASPRPSYGDRALRSWAEQLAALWSPSEDLFVYFNNDPGGAAARDARRFARQLAKVGLVPTRVPGASETPLQPTRSLPLSGPQRGRRSTRAGAPPPSR